MVRGHFKGRWMMRARLCPMCIDGNCKGCCYLKKNCINYDLIIPPECRTGIYAYKMEE